MNILFIIYQNIYHCLSINISLNKLFTKNFIKFKVKSILKSQLLRCELYIYQFFQINEIILMGDRFYLAIMISVQISLVSLSSTKSIFLEIDLCERLVV
jgi:hypothetical protein